MKNIQWVILAVIAVLILLLAIFEIVLWTRYRNAHPEAPSPSLQPERSPNS